MLGPRYGSLWLRTVFACGMTAVMWTSAHAQDTGATRDYQVKAAFLFNFARYVTWPATAQPKAGTSFRVAIIGRDPFGKTLDQAFARKQIAGRGIVIERLGPWAKLTNKDRLKKFQIVFIANTSASETKQVLTTIGKAPVLTVSDTSGFARAGGGIELFLEAGKIRFAIDQAVLHRAKLKASSKLLKLARPQPIPSGRKKP